MIIHYNKLIPRGQVSCRLNNALLIRNAVVKLDTTGARGDRIHLDRVSTLAYSTRGEALKPLRLSDLDGVIGVVDRNQGLFGLLTAAVRVKRHWWEPLTPLSTSSALEFGCRLFFFFGPTPK
jgi:hypothetical protein